MPNARLRAIELTRFKSYEQLTRIELSPLTVLFGRNNDGKSTIIQALLLLRQTLQHPRRDVALHLEGPVDAISLRDLTFGWPGAGNGGFEGPTITLEWDTEVDLQDAWRAAGWPDRDEIAKNSGLPHLGSPYQLETRLLRTRLTIHTVASAQQTALKSLILADLPQGAWQPAGGALWKPKRTPEATILRFEIESGAWRCAFAGRRARPKTLEVDLDHFLPYVHVARGVGPRTTERAWANVHALLFARPLDELRALILDLQYLGSTREIPPPLYRPASLPPEELGARGEYAAQLIHARQSDRVHCPPLARLDPGDVELPSAVRPLPLVEAVNEVLTQLDIHTSLEVRDIESVGFQLLFGGASLAHVGRGLTYLLPVVELGLFADPLRFGSEQHRELSEYLAACQRVTHLCFEEPEAHLHPKVQSLLAHWMVALARAQRQVIIETHSDHFVRRLRLLAARASAGGEAEGWLCSQVSLIEVAQDETGRSGVTPTRLTTEGGLAEHWPTDFMDEASEQESKIYYAALEKQPSGEDFGDEEAVFVHDVGPEPEADPAP